MKLEGLDEELKEQQAEKTETIEEAKKKRAPYHIWTVGDKEYKLKLTAQAIKKLENKYKANIMNLIVTDGLPPLTIMLTVIQAALIKFHHGLGYDEVEEIYETYQDEGGNMTELLSDVVMPLMAVSGFFTDEMAKSMTKMIKDSETSL